VPVLTFESKFECDVDELRKFHASTDALRVLTPPEKKVQMISEDLSVSEGSIQKLKAWQWGIPTTWEVRIHDVSDSGFTDTAIRSPFKYWSHRHDFIKTEGGCILKDTVTYGMPFSLLGQFVDQLIIRKDLESLFNFRHEATQKALSGV
jgi:ligand-binding SRPBCC domain-containing protein